MGNQGLNNNNIKLVKYTIVCIDRKHERVLHADEKIVVDPMSHAAFASWMIAERLFEKFRPPRADATSGASWRGKSSPHCSWATVHSPCATGATG